MKTYLFSIAVAIVATACSNNNSNETTKNVDSISNTTQANNSAEKQTPSVDAAVNAYLKLKNALVGDNSKEAADAGNQLRQAMQGLEGAGFNTDQKKVYDEVKEDINEHTEHISDNANNIAHQREHFDMLSQDMYDMVKSVKPSQTLYQTHCPMYNDKKGAIWLSETKEIKNPYYGKEMLTCGTVKEEIKQ